jgi:hypothetical protein
MGFSPKDNDVDGDNSDADDDWVALAIAWKDNRIVKTLENVPRRLAGDNFCNEHGATQKPERRTVNKSDSMTNTYIVRSEVSMAVTMKNAVFWDVTPRAYCMNRRFGGTWRLHHQGDNNR